MKDKQNTILILMDELLAWEQIPHEIKQNLKGYMAFKERGIEFTNIHNNRTVCTSSRGCIISGIINNRMQDNIDQIYQYNWFPALSSESDTVAKICKLNHYDVTAYYGKNHLDSSLASTQFTAPMLNTNTHNMMNKYGFDKYSVFGDNFYCSQQGMLSDLYTWDLKVSDGSNQYDWINQQDGSKHIGMLPFLKARCEDKKSFYCEYHITNPHDTQHQIQNFEQIPNGTQLQFGCPFMKEQMESANNNGNLAINPYEIIDNKFINTNRFESTYESYKSYYDKLPFINSFMADYVSNSTTNNIFPYYVANQKTFENVFTFPNDQNDIKSWKNLINTYWGLVIEADNYIYKIYEFLKSCDMLDNTNIIITADHGDQLSAHGLKQKNFPFKESTNIPLLICSNNLDKTLLGTKSDILGSSINIAPTLVKLLNLQSCENKFVGKSLLECSNNGLIPTYNQFDVFHITNGWMFSTSYFNWANWYNSQPPIIQNRVVYNPQNFFEYLSPFTMCITNIDGVQWKFVRYFNIIELVIYNLKHNNVILSHNKYKSKFTFDDILNSNFDNEYDSYLNNIKTILNDEFTFEEGYECIKNKHSIKDSIELYIYIIFIVYYIKNIINADTWILPGLYSQHSEIKSNKNYAFYCYNMTDDKEEVINLSDPLYPERHNNTLFNILNAKLNESIIEHKCKDFYYNVPTSLLFIILGIFIKNSSNYINYDKNQLAKLLTLNFTNNFDTAFDMNYIIKILTIN
jgi:arylsulfatase A-like enzyme